LMCPASLSTRPSLRVLLTRSLPARSTRHSLDAWQGAADLATSRRRLEQETAWLGFHLQSYVVHLPDI
jgi:hypothetical protein